MRGELGNSGTPGGRPQSFGGPSGVGPDEVHPLLLKEYFERKVPLGADAGWCRLLTQMSMLAARAWELVERKDMEGLQTFPILMSLYVEQLAIDRGSRGESEIPWFLTGLPTPNYHLTSQNRTVLSEEPFASLAHPKWINANLAYLRDLDFYRKRQAEVQKTTARDASAPAGTAPKPTERRGKKAKAKKSEE